MKQGPAAFFAAGPLGLSKKPYFCGDRTAVGNGYGRSGGNICFIEIPGEIAGSHQFAQVCTK